MKINKIEVLDFDTVYNILTSNKISESQKTQFIRKNKTLINKIIDYNISEIEFKTLMKNRTLQKLRPIKNSYTKAGDKIILAKILNISSSEVPQYIKNVTKNLEELKNLDFLPYSTMEMLKTYVYRHGSKDELVVFLDYELTKTKDILKTLYSTLEYYSGGVADYFIRPIHRMDNKTLIKVYSVINKHIKLANKNGDISDLHSEKIAKWALARIYRIQNNSKLINAIKTLKTLS